MPKSNARHLATQQEVPRTQQRTQLGTLNLDELEVRQFMKLRDGRLSTGASLLLAPLEWLITVPLRASRNAGTGRNAWHY